MRSKAELRRMRRARGEPGGFGLEEGVSMFALADVVRTVLAYSR